MFFVASFVFQANKASAVEFEFYYQKIVEVKTINEDIESDDSLWTKFKKTVKKGVNAVKRTWEDVVTRNLALGEGEKTWYSKEDHNLAYKVERVKVSTEAELLAAMGVKSEDELNNGQKAMLEVFRNSQNEAIQAEAKIGYLPKVHVILSDTTGYDDSSKYPNVRKDFWPYSSGLTINLSTNCYNYPNSAEDAVSTLVHEFAHSLDMTFKEMKNPYGLDGSHYGNEITGKRAAFVEAWAEYNEMIASEKEAQSILNNTKVLCEESKDVAGSYTTNIKEEDATADQLQRSEAHLAKLLYLISTDPEIENGKDKVYKAFTSTRWNVLRTMPTLIKKFVKQNPEDTEAVCRIVDEVFLGKLSEEEFYKYVGKNKTTQAYWENRGKETEEENKDIDASKIKNQEIEDNVSSGTTVIIETDNNDPFAE